MFDEVGCLNKDFRAALKKLEWTRTYRDGRWGYDKEPLMRLGVDQEMIVELWGHERRDHYINSCCGVGDVFFEGSYSLIGASDELFEAYVAQIINAQLASDRRVYMCGLPICNRQKKGIPYYEKIAEVLIKFGATQLTKRPYKNKNTGNYILSFAFRRPPGAMPPL